MIVLAHGDSQVGVLPETGAALAFWTHRGVAILHPVADANLPDQHGQAVGAYPLIPYSNRVGEGRFSFDGETFELAHNFAPERNSIHGNAWQHAWEIAEQGEDYARLTFDHDPSTPKARAEWPFAYHAALLYRLDGDALEVCITVHNTDRRRQPVGLGWHPFFPKVADTRLGFDARSVWHKTPEGLPDGRLRCEGEFLYAPARTLDGVDIDHCFSGWDQRAALTWPPSDADEGRAIEITADSVFGHLVVYVPPGKDFFAVEPATNMTDAVNHLDIADAGLSILDPGAHVTGSARLALRMS